MTRYSSPSKLGRFAALGVSSLLVFSFLAVFPGARGDEQGATPTRFGDTTTSAGGSTAFSTSSTTSVTSTSSTLGGHRANFEAVHFPTLLFTAGISDPTMDVPFLNMLREAGVTTIAVQTDPTEFQAYSSRMTNLITAIRSDGLKLHIVSDIPDINHYQIVGLPQPWASPPTIAQFTAWEAQGVQNFASFKPDYLSVIVEPSIIQTRIHASYTVPQWLTLIGTLCSTLHKASPATQCWVALLPTSSLDLSLVQPISNNLHGSVNGIGFDMYDHTELLGTVSQAAAYAQSKGLSTGITETWAEDIYVNPQYDVPAFAPYEAQWLSNAPVSLWAWAYPNRVTGAFSPFFTNKFVSLSPLPLPITYSGTKTWFANLASDLQSNQRTQIFYAYQNLIANN